LIVPLDFQRGPVERIILAALWNQGLFEKALHKCAASPRRHLSFEPTNKLSGKPNEKLFRSHAHIPFAITLISISISLVCQANRMSVYEAT
jgi:hypothetical protein